METVAIPRYNEEVAPCFEAARTFVIIRLDDGRTVSQEVVQNTGCKGFGNLQLLRERGVNTLICNGIKVFYRDALVASNITVISDISDGIEAALERYVSGELSARENLADTECTTPIPLQDLVCWTKELFSVHGYRVSEREEPDQFPIDLVAEIDCPVCNRPVRIAICCGAHTYRCRQEISELNRVAKSSYDARVYVRPTTPQVETCCREYGIELIDPNAKFASADHPTPSRLPILQQPVEGHEKASGEEA